MPSPPTGQAFCIDANTAVPLSPSPVQCVAWSIKAPKSNGATVFIGGATVTALTGHALDPGDSFDYQLNDQSAGAKYSLKPSDLYVAGALNDRVTWFASPTLS